MARKVYGEVFEKMGQLYAHGVPYTQIALKMGLSPATVYGYTAAVEKGFASLTDYNRHRMQEKQKVPQNQELSVLIEQQLAMRGQNKTWLSDEIGVRRQSVSLYCQGKIFPKPAILAAIYRVLEVDLDYLKSRFPLLARTYSDLEKIVA